MYFEILPISQVGPLNPVDEQLHVCPPFPSLEHTPLFLHGFEAQGSIKLFIYRVRVQAQFMIINILNFKLPMLQAGPLKPVEVQSHV